MEGGVDWHPFLAEKEAVAAAEAARTGMAVEMVKLTAKVVGTMVVAPTVVASKAAAATGAARVVACMAARKVVCLAEATRAMVIMAVVDWVVQ